MELSYYDGVWAYGCIIVAFLIVTLAQVILRVVYAKWKQVDSNSGMTGEEVARKILDMNGLRNVRINMVGGTLSDYYDPRVKTVNLSSIWKYFYRKCY